MEKNRILTQSLNHSPSLFDAPGTEALKLWKMIFVTTVLHEYAYVVCVCLRVRVGS